MEEDVQALKDVSSRIMHIFLKGDLRKTGEADSIEDEKKEYLKCSFLFRVYNN